MISLLDIHPWTVTTYVSLSEHDDECITVLSLHQLPLHQKYGYNDCKRKAVSTADR